VVAARRVDYCGWCTGLGWAGGCCVGVGGPCDALHRLARTHTCRVPWMAQASELPPTGNAPGCVHDGWAVGRRSGALLGRVSLGARGACWLGEVTATSSAHTHQAKPRRSRSGADFGIKHTLPMPRRNGAPARQIVAGGGAQGHRAGEATQTPAAPAAQQEQQAPTTNTCVPPAQRTPYNPPSKVGRVRGWSAGAPSTWPGWGGGLRSRPRRTAPRPAGAQHHTRRSPQHTANHLLCALARSASQAGGHRRPSAHQRSARRTSEDSRRPVLR
jgi:hypothetical protein